MHFFHGRRDFSPGNAAILFYVYSVFCTNTITLRDGLFGNWYARRVGLQFGIDRLKICSNLFAKERMDGVFTVIAEMQLISGTSERTRTVRSKLSILFKICTAYSTASWISLNTSMLANVIEEYHKRNLNFNTLIYLSITFWTEISYRDTMCIWRHTNEVQISHIFSKHCFVSGH